MFFTTCFYCFTDAAEDALVYAEALYECKEYTCALHFLTERGLLPPPASSSPPTEIGARLLLVATMCFFAQSQYNQCVDMLEKLQGRVIPPPEASLELRTAYGSLWLLRGKANCAIEKRIEAVDCWRAALQCDPLCAEAWQELINSHALSSREWDDLYQNTKKAMLATCDGDETQLELLLTFYAAATTEAATECGNAAVTMLERQKDTATHIETLTAKACMLLQQRRYVDALHTIKPFVLLSSCFVLFKSVISRFCVCSSFVEIEVL